MIRKNKKGFTLTEIIVVLVIIGIMIAIAAPTVMKYVDDAKNTKYLNVARAIEQETIAYSQDYMLRNPDEDFDQVVAALKKKFSWGSEMQSNPPVSAKAPEGEKIHSIDVSFDGTTGDIGWKYDKTKKTHKITKVSIWFATDDGKITASDARFVVILLGEDTYYYDSYDDAEPFLDKKQGPIIPL